MVHYPVIPPYLLERLVQLAPPAVRQSAAQTLRVDMTLRPPSRAVPRAPPVVTGEAAPQRAIHDAAQGMRLPGILVRSEGTPAVSDVAVNEAYDHLGASWQLFHDVFNRNSLDGAGMALVATVHYGEQYDNAFWNGTQMVFGDGDGEVFNRFTASLDVVAHELTHGVIDGEGGLTYALQSGALNESICDVFGSLARQYQLRQTAEQADWLIGAGLFTDKVQAKALRSLAAPGTAYDDPLLGKDPQPAHMRDFVQTTQDNGGVHINSGIPTHAFYLAATAIGGFAWERIGQVWYDSLLHPERRADCDFAQFAQLTGQVAAAMGDDVLAAVRQGWQGVGLQTGNGAWNAHHV